MIPPQHGYRYSSISTQVRVPVQRVIQDCACLLVDNSWIRRNRKLMSCRKLPGKLSRRNSLLRVLPRSSPRKVKPVGRFLWTLRLRCHPRDEVVHAAPPDTSNLIALKSKISYS